MSDPQRYEMGKGKGIKGLQQRAFAEEIQSFCEPSPMGETPLMKQLNGMLRADKLVLVSRITEAEVEDSVK